MSYTIFDTETTGLPVKGSNWQSDFESFPRVVQLAWKNSGDNFVNNYIVKPDGFAIPDDSIAIHGISNEQANREGVSIRLALNMFINDTLKSDLIIGHNVYFDTSIIKSEVLRIGNDEMSNNIIEALDKSKRIDTMMKTIKFCSIKQNDSNRLKFPTLVELYDRLFSESFNAHDANEDVIATEKCYLKLIELGVI